MTPQRPKDTNQLAKRIVDLATGQDKERYGKDPIAVKRGQKSGRARALAASARRSSQPQPMMAKGRSDN